MSAAAKNEIAAIDGDCGGMCACATCHVYVDQDEWWDKVGGTNKNEESIMSLNPERHDNSRLSCQIKMSDKLNGLVVHTPEFQY